MTYLLICLPFLAVAACVAVLATVRMPRAARRTRLLALGIAFVLIAALTAVFDSVMIAAGLFGYADGTRLGPTVWLAPVEDFAYPLAAVLLVPAVFSLALRRGAPVEGGAR
ncbi:lycopene cyclase domain-containing protein [Agromyces terreus]|uniref:Lycopene cyclase domain-containing protein n=1 Tax=Agromyces terreus TaxID=424795 RepID=A0A9X2H6G7_9MICO|nr:lycopene cyclase domain-containing protein [Agromyces terreus]MCP2371672.1 lycopene cyclase domain-containing protein [Agromyces terreus]